ncbi:MAG: GFA family protein [Candidatus Andeanibacterium colombiense]|uniref:GFA family protein n=1 Tax=Candidatus Andeanibacterium colombiense TaxID=3121345 RepID=A0AAJ6BM15_9SPHN|nr:MAG: GFA family protein [Sphingomonadaceae bacterium]
MPLKLEGSCRCGAVRFSADSHAPVPFMRCYCSICRKTAGGGGYAINLHADAATLKVEGKTGVFHAELADGHGGCETSTGERHFCPLCASALWVFSPEWPELVHPFASAIDSELPKAPSSVHLMLDSKASWVEPRVGPDDRCFDRYPDVTLEDWHRARGLWLD